VTQEVATWYVDTSAALKLILEEAESAALAEAIDSTEPVLAACRLLETEMRRAAHREPALHQDHVTAFLDGVDLYEMPAALFRQAGLLPGPRLRSLDALHLAAAIALDVDTIVTYDVRLAAAAQDVGLEVIQPT
jgi:hypothetical protein